MISERDLSPSDLSPDANKMPVSVLFTVLVYRRDTGILFREKKPRQSPVFFVILNFRNFSHTPFHCAHIEIPKMRLRARGWMR
jgi:hypothetical protein